MQSLGRVAAAALCVVPLLVLAGCASPEPAADPVPTAAASEPAHYDLAVRVSQETAAGAPLPGVEVVAYALDGDRPTGIAYPATTTGSGVASFRFDEPTRLALRATLPGWTQEGAYVDVGPQLVSPDAAVSDRDLFLPLYHQSLRLATALRLSTATVAPGQDPGTLEHPVATATLELPAAAKAGYLARLTEADVRLAWDDAPAMHADLAAGLAWNGGLWVAGDAPAPALGHREATLSGTLPAEGRPGDLDAARLEAAAVLETAVVGDVPVAWEVTLGFGGHLPPGLPVGCHATAGAACLPPLPPA